MKLQSVESSMIQSVGYDQEAEVLQVMFNSGKIYQYYGVPKAIYDGLMTADSKGSYMRQAVIDCYPYRTVGRQQK